MLLLDRIIWLLTAIILAGALSSCETTDFGDRVWYKQGGTIEERDRLLAAAQVQAVQSHTVETPGAPDQAGSRQRAERQAVIATMTAAGWRLVPKAEAGSLQHAKKTPNLPRSMSAPTSLDR